MLPAGVVLIALVCVAFFVRPTFMRPGVEAGEAGATAESAESAEAEAEAEAFGVMRDDVAEAGA